jgi:RNA polymerase sigma factor (sigma-70 family)
MRVLEFLEEATEDQDNNLWFEITVTPEFRDKVRATVKGTVPMPDAFWDTLEQDLLIHLWQSMVPEWWDSEDDVMAAAIEFSKRGWGAERVRQHRQNKRFVSADEREHTHDSHLELGFEQMSRLLPERQGQAAMLYYVDGLTQEETAEVMGISRQAVGSLLRKVKGVIRDLLDVAPH